MNDIFLSCDWGTSSFRLRLIDTVSTASIATSCAAEGIAYVFEAWQKEAAKGDRFSFYRSVLHKHIINIEKETGRSLNKIPVVVSGMASSSIGMKELPYKYLPFLASASDLHYEVFNSTEPFSNPVILISGARTQNDVMRGEETQLAGCVQQPNDQQQVYIFPGTHSKHVYVQKGYAVHFETYMTGEVFQLLSQHSILSKSVFTDSRFEDGENRAAFEKGVLAGRQQHLLHAAFMVRTNDLFQRFSKKENYWYLSGLLIGSELSVLLQKNTGAILIVAEGTIAQSYSLAFKALGLEVGVLDAASALIQAHAGIIKRL